MRVAFVGVKRKYKELDPSYIESFNRYHLELPWYYARSTPHEFLITTVDHEDDAPIVFDGGGTLRCVTEDSYRSGKHGAADVVVHWRRWFADLKGPRINLLNCQDQGFSDAWLDEVKSGYWGGGLHGFLCFPGWHELSIKLELKASVRTFSNVTLGVDSDVYSPSPAKDPWMMLWASDPGRGLMGAVEVAADVWRHKRRFKLHVCYPDYVKSPIVITHPAVVVHGSIPNGPKLWNLFNTAGWLPYSSTFHEPSSRAHRQAQSAGAVVIYPPLMGTPSKLIDDGMTGYVREFDKFAWRKLLIEKTGTDEQARIAAASRALAVSEDWRVQADRFDKLIRRLCDDKSGGRRYF